MTKKMKKKERKRRKFKQQKHALKSVHSYSHCVSHTILDSIKNAPPAVTYYCYSKTKICTLYPVDINIYCRCLTLSRYVLCTQLISIFIVDV